MARLTEEQEDLVITYMEEHVFFARNQMGNLGSDGKRKLREMWNQLEAYLLQRTELDISVKDLKVVVFFY